jgi:putative exosortase-associated protein (TIGR04073 family)
MRGSKLISAAAVAALLGAIMVPASAEAQTARDKLERGFVNIAFGLAEVPGTILEESKASNPVQGLTVGLVKGAFRAVRRELVGVYEFLTFPVDTPAGFEKIVEPEYPWAYFQ